MFLVVLLLGLPLAFLVRSVTDEGWREIVPLHVLQERDVIYLSQLKIFLVAGQPPVALSAVSPHLGDRIVYCPDGRFFTALGHGERFDRSGRYGSGPGGRDMHRIATRVREGNIEVNVPRVSVDETSVMTTSEDPFRGVCNFKHWTESRPGFLERERA